MKLRDQHRQQPPLQDQRQQRQLDQHEQAAAGGRQRGGHALRGQMQTRGQPQRQRPQLEPQLRAARRKLPIAARIEQPGEHGATRLGDQAKQRQRDGSDHADGQERKLKADVGEHRGLRQQQHDGRQRHHIQQLQTPVEQPCHQHQCRHRRRTQNRRALLDDGHVSGQRHQGQHDHHPLGPAQQAAQPEEKRGEHGHVQPGQHEHVIDRGFLEILSERPVEKVAVAEEHGPQQWRMLGRRQMVEAIEPAAAQPRQAGLPAGRSRGQRLEQFRAAQRAGEHDARALEHAAAVGGAGIEKVARQAGARQHLDAITGTHGGRRRPRRRTAITFQPHPALHRQPAPGLLDRFQIEQVAHAPGRRPGILAQPAVPAQRLAQIEPAGGHQTIGAIGGDGAAFS